MRVHLEAKMAEHNRTCDYGNEISVWWVAALWAWFNGQIDLYGRFISPRADLLLINYPQPERRPHLFDLDLLPLARLRHLATKEYFFDVHAVDQQLLAMIATAAAQQQGADNEQPGVPAQRAALFFTAWQHHDFPSDWNSTQCWHAALKLYPQEPLLKNISPKLRQNAWAAVQHKRKI